MNCSCGQTAISEKGFCEEHFIDWFHKKVFETIIEQNMIRDGDKILVAASGGKDSLTLLDILSTKYNVTAFCIDEGIPGYREHTIVDLQKFCAERNIPLKIVSFENEKGSQLQSLALKHPCTTCGVWRRELMAEASKEFDVIATGHNLDDEAQAIMMNIAKHHPMKPRPVLEGNEHFTRRVKPLYFISESDVRRYAFLKNLVEGYVECPNAELSHRRAIQHFLENRERDWPGSKEQLVRNYLESI